MGCCELGNGPEHGLLSRVWSAAQSQPCEPRRQGGRAQLRRAWEGTSDHAG